MKMSMHSRRGQTRWDWIVAILLGLMVFTLVVPFVANHLRSQTLPTSWKEVSFDFFWAPRCRTCDARCQTINNLKQLSLALHSYNDVHRRLPPAFDQFGQLKSPAALHVHLLPFIEQGPLYAQYVEGKRADLDDQVIPPFINPIDWTTPDGKGVQNFAGNLRVFSDKGVLTPHNASLPALAAIEPGTAGIPRTFTDGTSNTIVFSTRLAICGDGGSRYAAAPDSPFAAFIGQDAATLRANSFHMGATFLVVTSTATCVPVPLLPHGTRTGVLVGLGDGSVRTISPQVSPETWNRAMQPNDGGKLASDWDS